MYYNMVHFLLQLYVLGIDNAPEPKTATATITVNVNRNNPPSFQNTAGLTTTVSEGVQVLDTIVTAQATDPDDPVRPSSIYRISRIFRVRGFWQKRCLEGVFNFHCVLFSLFQGLSMKTYSRVYFSLSIFGDFRVVANSAKIKPTRKIHGIQYLVWPCNAAGIMCKIFHPS